VTSEDQDEELLLGGRGGSTTAELLTESVWMYWPKVRNHPLSREAGDGSLSEDVFERWMIADYAFNVDYRRFVAGLLTIAPNAGAAEVISLGLPAISEDARAIRSAADHWGIDLTAVAGPTTISFVSYLQALLSQGYPIALAAFFMSQKVYFEGWSAVRESADRASRYWPFIDSWSSAPYGMLISSLARLVNSAAPHGPSDEMYTAARRVVRFELSFWNAIYGGETW
jgi:thiaminase/transcriptional activator TenA